MLCSISASHPYGQVSKEVPQGFIFGLHLLQIQINGHSMTHWIQSFFYADDRLVYNKESNTMLVEISRVRKLRFSTFSKLKLIGPCGQVLELYLRLTVPLIEHIKSIHLRCA